MNPINQIYIGKSKNLLKRFYENGYGKSSKITESFNLHGFKNHTFEIIELCEINLLDEREKYWIKFYDCFDTPHGLNLQDGGASCKFSKETIKKLSDKKIGYKRSPETIEKIVKNLKTWSKDRPMPESTKRKISETVSKGLLGNKRCVGYKFSDEKKAERSAKAMATRIKNGTSSPDRTPKIRYIKKERPIIVNLETGVYYDSAKEASKDCPKYDYKQFHSMLRGTRTNKTPFRYI